jgi:hypothetical protein
MNELNEATSERQTDDPAPVVLACRGLAKTYRQGSGVEVPVLLGVDLSVAAGEQDHVLSSPTENQTVPSYQVITFGGITFEEYRGQASDINGTVRKFIAPGEAHAFPLGTVDTFGTYLAPADFNETVNTLGQPLYAKQEPRKFERGTDLHTQSNPLPMCHRPGVLVKLTSA